MSSRRSLALAFPFLLFVLSFSVFAQNSAEQAPAAKPDRTNLEVQLDVLVASSETAAKSTVPQNLDPIVKQLRQTLPYNNYNLVATYTNRVKSGSRMESKGVLASEVVLGQTASGFPCYYEYSLTPVKLVPDGASQTIEIPVFRVYFRLPIFMGMVRNDGSGSLPTVNYESVGLITELSLREATPTLVGTMTTMKQNQLLIIVISVKRTP